ncbi:hypothetical protein DS884_02555 [Tenacibaculum sp. E3R01]|uniref:hypothetical protein n=1 Tax=Tenacibaculum sp. E3R01 TaxID=2267227 RepID=UPI000DEB0670|nr:hypothetical protein [Tenacibaculum sp. E3R01]RBW62501.1 hypothetical protein DS884_02555 [Tenacibaculum sp. E3R01]
MNDRNDIIIKDEIRNLEFIQKVEKSLCEKLNIPDLRPGNITIREKKNWRENEKEIDYCWLVNVSKSFVGWCWIFSLKFNETHFRNYNNPGKIIQGIFTVDKNANIENLFLENRKSDFKDKIKGFNNFDLFKTNPGITLDGITYKYLIYSRNATIKFELNNPNSKNWKKWEKLVNQLGTELSEKSKIKEFREIFN